METIYFVLGMLSIIGAAFVATVVWGVVKIIKLLKTIKQQEEWIINNNRNIHDNLHNMHQEIECKFKDSERHIHDRVTELQRELDVKFNNTTSYIDSRVDKVSSSLKEQKQLIKG